MTTRKASRLPSSSKSAGDPLPRSATATVTCRCCNGPLPDRGRDSRSTSTTPMPSANGPTTENPALAASTKASTKHRRKAGQLSTCSETGWSFIRMRKNSNWQKLDGPAYVGFSCGRQAGAAVTVWPQLAGHQLMVFNAYPGRRVRNLELLGVPMNDECKDIRRSNTAGR
jgi:hypothetical protein